jgi:DNA-binding MarR family transcriptional regulator
VADGSDRDHEHLLDDVIDLLVSVTARMSQHFTARAADFGLSAAEGKVLLALDAEATQSMRSVARSLGLDPSNLTTVVDRLEGRDLVTRSPEVQDRRVKAVGLTAAGRRVRQQLAERLRAGRGPLGALSDPQLRELRELLRDVVTDTPGEPAAGG